MTIVVSGRKKWLSGPVVIRSSLRNCRTNRYDALRLFDNGRARSSMAEQGTHNPLVVGSNPAGPTREVCEVSRDDAEPCNAEVFL